MRRTVLMIGIALLTPVVAAAQPAGSEASLKAVHAVLMQAVTSGNVSAVSNLVNPAALGFFRESERLVQLGSDFGPAQVVPAVVADLGQFSSVPFVTAYRVIGDVGIVAMTSNQQPKKGVDVKPRYLRSTYVYTLVQGDWRLVSWHTSDTPLKR
jgi:SnoaL-like domain